MWRSAPGSWSFTMASIARRGGDGGATAQIHAQGLTAVRVSIVGEGRLRAPYLDDVEHYQKLLSRYVTLDLVWCKDAESVLKRVPQDAHVCLLEPAGRSLDSVQFSRFVEERREGGGGIAFVIGGAFGAPRLARVDSAISLGPITLPHQLAWVVLLEQLYRAHKIIAREPYHH